MSLTRRVAYNTVIQMMGRVIGIALSLVTITALTRYFGPATYGNYSIAFLYGTIIITFADAGIYAIGLREMAQDPERSREIGGRVVALRTAVQAPIFVALALLTLLLPYPLEVRYAIIIAIVAAYFSSVIASLGIFYQHSLRLDFPTIADIATKVVSLAGILTLIHFKAPFLAITAVAALSSFVGLLIMIGFCLKDKYPLWSDWDRPWARRLVMDSLPLALVTIIGYMHFKVDSVILSLLKPSYDIGIYSVAYKVIEIIIILPTLYISTVYPILSRYWIHDKDKYRESVQRSFNFLFLLGVPMVVGLLILSPQVVDLIAGHDFKAAALPLQILTLASFFSFFNVLYSNLAIIQNLQRRIIWISVAALAINIVLNLIFIPQYSYVGAAVTTVISEAFAMLTKARFGGRVSFSQPFRIILAGAGMGVVIWALTKVNIPLLALVPIGAAVYALLALGVRAISLNELKQAAR